MTQPRPSSPPAGRRGSTRAPRPPVEDQRHKIERAREHHHVLVQATVAPLDQNGIVAFAVGTVLFALTFAVAWFAFRQQLRASGHDWWLWVMLAGSIIGALALAYCLWRQRPRDPGPRP